jgi:hypothetical protein
VTSTPHCRCGVEIQPTEQRCASCPPIHINDGHGLALCKNTDGPLVTGALHSDCRTCRELQMVGPVTQKSCEWRPEPVFPLSDDDE